MPGASRYPFSPYPQGWFCVAEADELPEGRALPLHFFGRELAAFRGEDGRARVLDAHCPHLGAHLGVGGRVQGTSVRCPFHAWRWDGDSGRCVEVPYAKRIPPKARVRAWPVIEWAGFVLVWHGDGEPAWRPDLPDAGPEHWLHCGTRRWTVRTHVQEIGENGLDVAHVAYVHGAEPLDVVDLRTDGPTLFFETRPPEGSPNAAFVHSIRRTLWGIGLSLNEFRGKVESRVVITRTPIDAERSDVRIAFLPRRYAQAGLSQALGQAVRERVGAELEGDIAIWEHKAYVDPPLLCDGDGPIPVWRRWCRQFYPGPAAG